MTTWQYAVTTVPQRWNTTLPTTIRTLVAAGFVSPMVAVDESFSALRTVARQFGGTWIVEDVELGWFHQLRVVTRHRPLGAFGNWHLTAIELFNADPRADRYVIFQDDIVVCRGLRKYLDSIPHTPGTYRNCITFPDQKGVTYDGLFEEAELSPGWNRASSPLGLGAQALVFDNDGMQALLKNPMLAHWPTTVGGKQGIDGVVKGIMQNAGYVEYVHQPSLVDHVMCPSTIRDKVQPKIVGFPGEEFDAMSLLKPEAA